ncbi:phosphonate metabolism transcriptional regulator PhnF [Sulfitobacter alexandrii]|uniref:Phosphonate metabolism transcriptional regulator PhnF n=1 Tax=Sulfitobacter alexandrii TaxID=1917485 RepID=A0A1J0WJM1_9RHOB|nr:phosphonate metabolism transcriptional regulator PhnF [Sulfitobacter alexandrii]APE44506.1 phosphonate metabolism transcriptional regulator PhnF [Sulfitobacter alexandrii]
MPRTPIWRSIADTLGAEIADGQYGPGDKLPTEAALAARFGVNRHTVRHALAALAERGVVHARRGAGVFVTQVPTDYPIGKRVRFHQNLSSAGRVPTKRLLAMQTRAASPTERTLLDLEEGAEVHVVEGLSLADDLPVAVFTSVFPAARLPDLPAHLGAVGSVTEALRRSGVPDYTRASTRLKAKLATATQALHLQVREGAPVLFSTSVNVDSEGRPVEFGSTWFAGDRITLTLEGD